MVTIELEKRFNIRFRDSSELSQATKFLHENGKARLNYNARLNYYYYYY